MNAKDKAKNILNLLEKQRFAHWYHYGRFDDYIRVNYPKGHPKHLTKDMILKDIEGLFELKDDKTEYVPDMNPDLKAVVDRMGIE